jgi:photosystem II stability/assembly factor-like uncharacterized protein
MTAVHSLEYLTDVWVVGDHGFIAHQPSLGSTQRMDSPEPVNLYDVTFVAPNDGWIVGEDELILHWNGKDWEVSKPAVIDRWPYSYDLYSVAFNEANDGWAAGCIGSEGGEYFLVYHWDGTGWSEVSLSDERNLWACVHDIVAVSSTDVWMVGTGRKEGKEYGFTVHWDGINWKRFSDLVTYSIASISALSSDNIWAITRSGMVLNWNGVEWSEKAKLDYANSFSGPIIFAREPDDIFAAGNKVWHWNGTTWTDLSSHGNLPIDTEIKGIVEGSIDEGGHPFIYIVDSFGKMYSFTYEKFK